MNTYCGDSHCVDPKDKIPLKFNTKIVPVVGGGSTNYEQLTNKPSINGVALIGNKTNEEILIQALTNQDIEGILKNFK